MTPNSITRRAFALSSIALIPLGLSSFATVLAAETTTPKPVDLKKPSKIHLLYGQSHWLMDEAMGQGMVKLLKGN